MNQMVIKVAGMMCEGCVQVARQALEAIPGVQAVYVDKDAGQACVEMASPKITAEQLAKAVTDAGYDAQPA